MENDWKISAKGGRFGRSRSVNTPSFLSLKVIWWKLCSLFRQTTETVFEVEINTFKVKIIKNRAEKQW